MKNKLKSYHFSAKALSKKVFPVLLFFVIQDNQILMLKENIPERYNYLNIIYLVIIPIPILIYLYNVYTYALNIPCWDDYDAILDYLIKFKSAPFTNRCYLLFSQHNEHRILSSNIFYSSYYLLFGNINFRNIIYFNTSILLAIFFLASYFIKKCLPKEWLIATFVFSLCLFDTNNYENADFAMAGMQNYSVILIFMGSLFFYCLSDRKFLVFAALLQILCIYSSGNGNVGAFFLLVFAVLSKDKIKIIVSMSTFCLFAPLYYYHYAIQDDFFTLNPLKWLPYFLHTTSAAFTYLLGIPAGLLILFAFLYFLPLQKKWQFKENALPFICISGFVFASIGVLSLVRSKLPISSSHTSRYYIYCYLITSVIFVFLLLKLENKRIKNRVVAVFILVMLLTYARNYGEGRTGFLYFYNSLKSNQYFYPDSVRAKQLTGESCRLSIYCIEDARVRTK